MKRVRGKVDLVSDKGWNLRVIESLQDAVKTAVQRGAGEALESALADEETGFYMPAQYDDIGDKLTRDPLQIEFAIALADNDGTFPTFRASLKDVLQDTMAVCKQDGSYAAGLARVRDALLRLANDIDKVLPKP